MWFKVKLLFVKVRVEIRSKIVFRNYFGSSIIIFLNILISLKYELYDN